MVALKITVQNGQGVWKVNVQDMQGVTKGQNMQSTE
jgi:hypothetical protein